MVQNVNCFRSSFNFICFSENKYFYIKKIDFNEKIISEFKDVQEIIKNEIIMTEVNDFNFAENKEKLTNYSQNSLLYSNSFNFSKNIPNNFNFIISLFSLLSSF